MMKKCVGFAIFGAIVILSLAFVQPVTARESGQVAIIEGYDKYSSYIESIKEFGEKISSDGRLDSLAKGLTESEDLKNLAEKVFDVKSEEELKALVEEFGKVLEEKEEYQEIKEILERDYKDDIETIKEFADELKDNPEDMEKIIESLLNESTAYQEFGAIPIEAVLFSGKPVHYAIPEKSDVDVRSLGSEKGAVQKTAHQLGEDEKTSYTKDAIKRENPSGGVYVNGKKTGAEIANESIGIYVKRDINGNVYLHIPGYGWIDITLFTGPIRWLIILLLISAALWLVLGLACLAAGPPGTIGWVICLYKALVRLALAFFVRHPMIGFIILVILFWLIWKNAEFPWPPC